MSFHESKIIPLNPANARSVNGCGWRPRALQDWRCLSAMNMLPGSPQGPTARPPSPVRARCRFWRLQEEQPLGLGKKHPVSQCCPWTWVPARETSLCCPSILGAAPIVMSMLLSTWICFPSQGMLAPALSDILQMERRPRGRGMGQRGKGKRSNDKCNRPSAHSRSLT